MLRTIQCRVRPKPAELVAEEATDDGLSLKFIIVVVIHCFCERGIQAQAQCLQMETEAKPAYHSASFSNSMECRRITFGDSLKASPFTAPR